MSAVAIRILPTHIPGVADLLGDPMADERGYAVKEFERSAFEGASLPVVFAEGLRTFSVRGVVRGMHFQLPPATQGKTVFCAHGAIFDAVVDLRHGSPAYGQAVTRELRAATGNGLYVPAGCAHGFCVLGENAVVSYRLTTPYAPGSDSGVLWSSVGVEWPVTDPVVSERDRSLTPLEEFDSPFVFEGR